MLRLNLGQAAEVMKKGKLVVLEGTDGSGKGTQLQLLTSYLTSHNISHQHIDFPRYEDNIYGKLIGRYLNGEFGSTKELSPYLVSLMYAGDRMIAGPQIEEWLAKANLVIANRYVPSNKAFSGAVLAKEKRDEFFDLLDEIEYKTNNIPKEDLVIVLYVDPVIAQKNIDTKEVRSYLGEKKRDLHEKDLSYQQEVVNVYLSLAKKYDNWEVIHCCENDRMLPRGTIHQNILDVLKRRGIL